MKKRISVLVILMSFVWLSCEKQDDMIASIIDELAIDEYYDAEVFNESFNNLYRDWKLYEVTGGIHGQGHDLNFDILKIKKFGIYAFIRNGNILEFGKINIDEQTSDLLRITFIPDVNSEVFMYDSEKIIEFQGIDTLLLHSPCCDRYNYHFIRED
jgi:hypothetical protein